MTTHDTEDFFGPVKTPEQMAAEIIAARDRSAANSASASVLVEEPVQEGAPTSTGVPEAPSPQTEVPLELADATERIEGSEPPQSKDAVNPQELASAGESASGPVAEVEVSDGDDELDVEDPEYLANPSPELLAAAAVWFDEPIGRHAKKVDDEETSDEALRELFDQNGYFDDEPDRRFFGRRRSRD